MKPSPHHQKRERSPENPAEKQPLPTAAAQDIRTAKPNLETRAGLAGQGSALTPVQSSPPKVETTQAASKFQPPAGETVLLQSQPSSGEAVQAQVRFPAGS